MFAGRKITFTSGVLKSIDLNSGDLIMCICHNEQLKNIILNKFVGTNNSLIFKTLFDLHVLVKIQSIR